MSYVRKATRAPRLTGRALEAVVKLAETPGAGALLRARMLAELGVTELRRADMEEQPTPWPVLQPVRRRRRVATDLDALLERSPRGAGKGAPEGFCYASVSDYASAYRNGETTPLSVAEAVLELIDESERRTPPMRLFIAKDRRDLLAQAKASTERFERKEPLGPLDGVPAAVKDELDQEGYPTTVGTSFKGRRPADRDATVVGRLRAAGALLVGKTNMHEIGLGVTGLNPHHGTARNPHDPARFPGGSSSGSAATVAAGLCPIAVGADGGGSIRIPSALCGVVGLKPTFGRMSSFGSAPVCWSVGAVGPIAANARDAALAYMLMAGPDKADPGSLHQPAPVMPDLEKKGLSGLTLGTYSPWLEDADPAVVETTRTAMRRLEDAGARFEQVELPDLHLFRLAHLITIVAEMSASQMADLRTERTRYGLDVRLNMALSEGLSAADYVHAARLRTRATERMSEILASVDGILTPSTGCTAPLLRDDALVSGESDLALLERIMRFAPLANLTGLPAITFPSGYDHSSLPVGCQIIGRPWREDVLLRIAHVAEGPAERRRPRWFASPLQGSRR